MREAALKIRVAGNRPGANEPRPVRQLRIQQVLRTSPINSRRSSPRSRLDEVRRVRVPSRKRRSACYPAAPHPPSARCPDCNSSLAFRILIPIGAGPHSAREGDTRGRRPCRRWVRSNHCFARSIRRPRSADWSFGAVARKHADRKRRRGEVAGLQRCTSRVVEVPVPVVRLLRRPARRGRGGGIVGAPPSAS